MQDSRRVFLDPFLPRGQRVRMPYSFHAPGGAPGLLRAHRTPRSSGSARRLMAMVPPPVGNPGIDYRHRLTVGGATLRAAGY